MDDQSNIADGGSVAVNREVAKHLDAVYNKNLQYVYSIAFLPRYELNTVHSTDCLTI